MGVGGAREKGGREKQQQSQLLVMFLERINDFFLYFWGNQNIYSSVSAYKKVNLPAGVVA